AALELWRGDPFVDVAYEPFARAAVAELDALCGEAVELRLESEILAGRPRDAIPGLEAAVENHPLPPCLVPDRRRSNEGLPPPPPSPDAAPNALFCSNTFATAGRVTAPGYV